MFQYLYLAHWGSKLVLARVGQPTCAKIYIMESESQYIPKLEKPPVLFHATRNSDIEIFEPRSEKTRNEFEGPKVFGTPSRALAGIFLVESDDSWVQSGIMDEVPYIIISDEERYRNLDNGGAVYSLPNDTFDNDPEKGLREFEWTSNERVRPTEKEVVPSALNDMLVHGVRIYFVSKETYRDILDSPDNSESIIKGLIPYVG